MGVTKEISLLQFKGTKKIMNVKIASKVGGTMLQILEYLGAVKSQNLRLNWFLPSQFRSQKPLSPFIEKVQILYMNKFNFSNDNFK